MIAGLILAAGESSRIGSPKALLKIGGHSFASHIISSMMSCGVQEIVLVAGAHYSEISKSLHEVNVIRNSQYSLGQFSSLQIGLQNVQAETTFVLVWPVDLPLVTNETVIELLAAARTNQNPVTVPVFNGKKGHPVVYSTETIKKIQSMQPTQTAKELFEYFESRVSLVEVSDPGILIDIDTPEDYEAYIRRGRF